MTTQAQTEQFDKATPDADVLLGPSEAPEPTDDRPKRRRKAIFSSNDAMSPEFVFDPPGHVKFAKAMLQWDSVYVDAGHTQVQFDVPFEHVLSGVVTRWRQPEPAISFTTYNGTLEGFTVFSDGPRMVSYLAFGR
jgi:hypothetical protein